MKDTHKDFMLVKTGDAQILEIIPEEEVSKNEQTSKSKLLSNALERAKTVVKPQQPTVAEK